MERDNLLFLSESFALGYIGLHEVTVSSIILGILLALHLLCMNVCSAGPLICIWLNRKRSSVEAKRVGLKLAWASFWTLPVGVALGLLLGTVAYFAGERDLISILPLFWYKIHWGIAEIVFSLVCSFGYWAWAKHRHPQKALFRVLHGGLAFLTATNLLYHFPSLMTVMAKSADGELAITEPVDAKIFRTLMYSPEVMAHVVHFWIASVAVGAVYVIWLAESEKQPRPIQLFGARLALAATIFQFVSGFWLVTALPANQQSLVLGGSLLATGLMIVSVLAAFLLLQKLANMALGDEEKGQAKHVCQLMLATVVLMSCALQCLR